MKTTPKQKKAIRTMSKAKHLSRLGVTEKQLKDFYVAKKLSILRISQIVGCNQKAIDKALGKCNIKKRTAGEQISISGKGRKFTEEHKANLVKARSWYKPSQETKKKIAEYRKGKKLSQEVKEKIGLSVKAFGYKHSEQFKERMRLNNPSKRLDVRERLSEMFKGDKSHRWKGGITSKNRIIRESSKYKIWRESVFKRDNYTCQKCSKKGGYLIGHHINNFAKCAEIRFDITNGATLCKNCHLLFHKVYGFRENNRVQFESFICKQQKNKEMLSI